MPRTERRLYRVRAHHRLRMVPRRLVQSALLLRQLARTAGVHLLQLDLERRHLQRLAAHPARPRQRPVQQQDRLPGLHAVHRLRMVQRHQPLLVRHLDRAHLGHVQQRRN